MFQIIEQSQNLIRLKKFKEALPKLRKINKTNKERTTETLNLEAVCLIGLNKAEKAEKVINLALLLTPSDFEKKQLLRLLSTVLIKVNNFEKAKTVLLQLQASEEGTKKAQVQLTLCQVCLTLNDYKSIEKFAPKLLNYSNYHLKAQEYLCKVALQTFDKDTCIKRLEKLTLYTEQLDTKQAQFLLVSLMNLNQYATIKKVLSKLTSSHSSVSKTTWYKSFYSSLLLQENEPKKVISMLASVVDNISVSDNTSRVLVKNLADAYELDKSYKLAFHTYLKLGTVTKEQYKKFKKQDVVAAYNNFNTNNLPSADFTHKRAQPVFMYGFPRSGTTLLENVLDTHPAIKTISEGHTIDNITNAIDKLFKKERYPVALQNLTNGQIEQLRDGYFKVVDELLTNKEDRNKLVIDKMPLNSVHLPLLKILFPTAKHIINIRHPMDVILSNIGQTYKINNEMSFLMTIDDCINRYIQVFDFINMFHSSYEISSITIRYEDLLNDMEHECDKLFKFLNVSTSTEFRNFHKHAQQKILNTNSNHQVIKPLYQSSKYKWINYQDELGQYLPLLDKYIKKYGYADD